MGTLGLRGRARMRETHRAAAPYSRRRVAGQTIHIRPTAGLAERVLLPGDPGRALFIAQRVLDAPRMFNHHRGLWGYTGAAPDGLPLSVQSTGMGGPSAAIVVEELIRLGARRLVRVGTAGALAHGLELGELVVAREALALDGASRALGAGGRVAADTALSDALLDATGPATAHAGAVASVDLFYDPDPQAGQRWRDGGAIAVEMESAVLFRLGALRGVQTASVLAVSDVVAPGAAPQRIAEEDLESAAERMGSLAARALS